MERLFYNIYRLLDMTVIGRLLIAKTEFEVVKYLPFDDYGIGVNTVKVLMSNLLKAFALFALTFVIAGFDKKYLLIAVVTGVACYTDSFIKWKRKQEMTILRQLSSYLSELRHEYYRNNDVEEAFEAAFDSAGEELKLHLGLIESEFANEGTPKNCGHMLSGRFLVIFSAICQSEIKYGDGGKDFVSNLDELQKNIDSDLLKWDREEFLFNSVFFIIISAFIVMPFMERWAVSQVEELAGFYDGYKGSLTRAASVLVTVLMLAFFEKMQGGRKEGTSPLLSAILEVKPINEFLERNFKKEKAGSRMVKIFEEYFPERSYSHFVLSRIMWFLFSFALSFVWLCRWSSSPLFPAVSLVIAVLSTFIPHLMLVLDGMFYESELEEEIGQLRIMAVSLSTAIGMTAEEMLLWMENFALYLRESLSICLDRIGEDENKALRELRDRWKTTSFTGIADNLLSSDKIGIKEAFADIFSRKDYYTAKRRQEQELNVRKKEAVLSAFMYLPFMLTVGIYMIAPFLYVSIKNLMDITNSFS